MVYVLYVLSSLKLTLFLFFFSLRGSKAPAQCFRKSKKAWKPTGGAPRWR